MKIALNFKISTYVLLHIILMFCFIFRSWNNSVRVSSLTPTISVRKGRRVSIERRIVIKIFCPVSPNKSTWIKYESGEILNISNYLLFTVDYSRVSLSDNGGDIPGVDYHNANFIKGASGSSAYIACQGPLPHTVNDFWRMVVECEVQVIVMACMEQESGKVLIFIYQSSMQLLKLYAMFFHAKHIAYALLRITWIQRKNIPYYYSIAQVWKLLGRRGWCWATIRPSYSLAEEVSERLSWFSG